MSELKPSIKQMLQIGYGCGLNMLEEAYHNYMNHYDCFFLIEKFAEQNGEFHTDLIKYGLMVRIHEPTDLNIDTHELKDITILEAMKIVGCEPLPEYEDE